MKRLMIAAVLVIFGFTGLVQAAEKAPKKEAAPKAEVPKAEAPKEEGESKGVKKGDKMTLIKIDKGEICDTTKSVLAKEKADKGKMYSLKYTLPKEKGGFTLISNASGILKGKRGNWKDYDTLNIKYILEGDKPLNGIWLIGDANSLEKWVYGNYCSKTAVLQPGENVASIDITGLVCDQGRQVDLENMRNILFFISEGQPGEDSVIYVQDAWVEKE